MPNRRAASRWLSPSTWQAWRTRPYSSTENIPAFPGSFRTNQGKPCRGTTLYRYGRTTQPSQWHIIPAPLSPERPDAARIHEGKRGQVIDGAVDAPDPPHRVIEEA